MTGELVLDRKELFIRLDDDFELLLELIDLFLEDYPQLMDEIEAAIRERDADMLKKAAHTLKGAVGNFCAYEAFSAAEKLELNGAQADFSSSEESYRKLADEMNRVEEELRSLASEYETAV